MPQTPNRCSVPAHDSLVGSGRLTRRAGFAAGHSVEVLLYREARSEPVLQSYYPAPDTRQTAAMGQVSVAVAEPHRRACLDEVLGAQRHGDHATV